MPSFTPYVDNEVVEEATTPEADAIADYDRYYSQVMVRQRVIQKWSVR